MQARDVKKLHDRILALVDRSITQIEQADELTDRDAKMVELLDKVVRAAIEIKSSEIPETEERSMRLDDLVAILEE